MIRRLLACLFLFALATPARAAETAVQFGLSTGSNPRVLCVYDNSAARSCVPIGWLDSAAHGFTPVIPNGVITAPMFASGAAAANLGFTPLAPANNLSELSNNGTARTNLGLGSIATVSPGTGVAAALAASLNATGGLVGYSGALGTPSSGVLTNATGLPISTGLTGAGSGVLTALGNAAGAAGGFATYSQLGSGAFAPAYTLPAATATVLGGVKPDGTTIGNISGAISVTYGTAANTAAQGNDSRITGAAQKASNLSDLANAATARTNLGLGSIATITPGTGVASALAASLNATGGLVGYSGALGTPTQAVLTNATGLPLSTGVTGTLQAAQEPAHTGDVTNSAGSLALAIAPSAVTSAKMASGAAAANLGFPFSFVTLNSSNGATDFFDLSGARQFEIYPFPGAVNYYAIQGNIANGGPTLSAQGSDANIDANIAAKGTGNVVLGNGLGVLAQFQVLNGLSPSVWPVFQSVQGGTVVYTASGTNTSINILPPGTGGFSAGPSEVVTGGNSVALGRFNQSQGFASITLGNNNYALGNYSVSTGNAASDHYVIGKRSHMSAFLGAAHGATQISEQAFAVQTTTATPATATSDGGAATNTNTIQVQANQTVASRILVVARDTTTGASAMWNILAFWNEGATASTLALVYSTGTGAPLASTGTGSTWTATLGTNTTTGYGYVICTGAAGETIRWTVRVDNAEDMNG